MTINFRRNALQLSVAALFSSAFMANAAEYSASQSDRDG